MTTTETATRTASKALAKALSEIRKVDSSLAEVLGRKLAAEMQAYREARTADDLALAAETKMLAAG